MSKWRKGDAPYTKMQPKDGDVILHCGHVDDIAEHGHFFSMDPRNPGSVLEFTRPDGTTGKSKWLVCCPACFNAKGSKFDVRADSIWQGDEPIVRVDPDVN